MSSDSDETAAILTLTLALALSLEQAKSMARLLLNLGAVSSQAEHNGTTAFQRYIESGRIDMIDTLLEYDKTGVKTAINHLIFVGYSWNPEVLSPLHTAIEHGDPILILKLLEVGASAEVDFETWLKASKFSPKQSNRLNDLDSNKAMFRRMEQPLITAVRWGEADTALKLLEKGADPNSLTPRSHSLFTNEYERRYTKGMSVLDMVQSSIKNLKDHRDANKNPTEKPEKRPGLDSYLRNFAPGTYSHAVVSWNVRSAQKQFERRMKDYEKDLEREVNTHAKDEKHRILGELISEFEALQSELLSRGAKTFEELHPSIQSPDNYGRNNRPSGKAQTKEPPKPYEYVFNFRGDKDLTDKRREGYIELYVCICVLVLFDPD